MVRFKDLNFGLSQFLHKVETEEDYGNYRFIINALKPNVIKESIKEGYFSKVPSELIDDSSVKKTYHEKIVKLKIVHLKTRDIANDKFFDYQGKTVRIKSKHREMWGSSEFNANVITVDFDEQRREFQLTLDVMSEGSSRIMFKRYGMYECDIESIVVID